MQNPNQSETVNFDLTKNPFGEFSANKAEANPFMEFANSNQEAPKQIANPKEDEPGVISDMASMWGVGSGQLLSGAGWLFGSETLSNLGESTTQYWDDKLSNAQKEANSKRFVTDDYELGDAVTDPRSWAGVIVQSLPMMSIGMGAAGLAGRGASALGATKATSAKIATGAATATEGATIGAMVGDETYKAVINSGENINHSPFYQDLIKAGKGPEVAREMTAQKAAEAAALPAGVGGAILGVAFNKFVGDAVTGSLSNRLTKETIKGAALEGATEVAQGTLEGVAKQKALNEEIDQDYNPAEIMNEMVAGAGAGAATGGLVGAAGSLSSTRSDNNPEANVQNIPTLDESQQIDLEAELAKGNPFQEYAPIDFEAPEITPPQETVQEPIGNEIDFESSGVPLGENIQLETEKTVYGNEIDFDSEKPVSRVDELSAGIEKQIASREEPLGLPKPNDIKLPGPVAGNANTGMEGVPAQVGRMDSDPIQNREEIKKAVERVQGGERYLNEKVSDFNKSKIKQARQEALPAGLEDERWLRGESKSRGAYKDAVKALTGQLVKGGNVAYIRDANDQIVGRTPSENPQWAQDIMAQEQVTVNFIKSSVEKALKGKGKLGARQARVITRLLDVVESEYTSQDNIDYVKNIRTQKNALRKAIRENNAAHEYFKNEQAEMPDAEYMDLDEATVERELVENESLDYDAMIEVEAKFDAIEAGIDQAIIDELENRYPDSNSFAEAVYRQIRENSGERRAESQNARAKGNDDSNSESASRETLEGRESGHETEVERSGGERPGRTSGTKEAEAAGQVEEELLTTYTEEDLQKREDDLKAREEALSKREAEAAAKEKADSEANDFKLTGSDQKADASPDQTDLLHSVKETAEKEHSQAKEKFEDFGNELGGARKDMGITREKGVKKRTRDNAKEEKDPSYYKKYEINEIVAIAGQIGKENVGKFQLTLKPKGKRTHFNQGKRLGVFDSVEEARTAIPAAEVSDKHRIRKVDDDSYEIYRNVARGKYPVIKDGFKTRDEAMKYMVTNAKELIEFNKNYTEADLRPNLKTVKRTGKQHRTGNVEPTDFQETFGFYAGQFGNWNNKADRQDDLNYAYDALLDLAEVLDIPPKAISLNGELSIAFGARGHGLSSASAHYERDYGVINLTKEKGAGALAHEWLHALDHYFGRQDGKTGGRQGEGKRSKFNIRKTAEGDYVSHGFQYKSGVRQEVRDSFQDLVKTTFFATEEYIEDSTAAKKVIDTQKKAVIYELNRVREMLLQDYTNNDYYKRHKKPASKEQLAEFDNLASRITSYITADNQVPLEFRSFESKARHTLGKYRNTSDELEAISKILKKVRGRAGWADKQVMTHVSSAINRYNSAAEKLTESVDQVTKKRRVPTNFSAEAKKIDLYRVSDYWSTEHEMMARAFESYIQDTIKESGNRSDYLAYGADNARFVFEQVKPYPEGEERSRINKAFKEFFSTLKTKETDTGIALFSLDSDSGVVANDANAAISEVEANTVIDRVTFDWSGGRENIALVNVFDELPAVITSFAKQKGIRPDKVKGVYHEGKLYLVRSVHKNAEMLEKTIFHEAYGHYGVFKLFGQNVNRVLTQIYIQMGGKSQLLRLARKHGVNLDNYLEVSNTLNKDQRSFLLMSELLAHMAEDQKPSVVRKVKELIGLVRNWLREKGFANLARYTDSDLFYLLKLARKSVKTYSAKGALNKESPLYSVEDADDLDMSSEARVERAIKMGYITDLDSVIEKRGSDEGRSRVRRKPEKTGVSRSRDADDVHAGGRLHGSSRVPKNTEALGNSRRGGDAGQVLQTFYHGTAQDIEGFNLNHPDRKDHGWLGEGVYLTDAPELANMYSRAKSQKNGGPESVIPVNIKAKKLYEATLDEKRKLQNTSLAESKKLTQRLKAAGYDGVVLRLANDAREIVIFDPSNIRSVNATFDPSKSDSNNILFSIDSDSDSNSQPSFITSIRSSVNDRLSGLKGVLGETATSFRYYGQDKYIDLKKKQSEIDAIPDDANPYLKASIWEGKAGERLNDFDENRVQPLLELVSKTGLSVSQVGEWLVARHAEEANAYLAEINPDKPSSERFRLSGMSNDEAQSILSRYANNAELQLVGRHVDRINNDRVKVLLLEGLITKDMARAWISRYKHYVPLNREEVEGRDYLPSRGKGFHIKGKETKQRTGSAYWKPDMILSNMIANHESTIVRAEKNRVGQALLKFVEQNPDDGFWSIDSERKTKSVRNGKVVEGVKLLDAPNELTIKRGGNEHVIVFNPGNKIAIRLASALKNLQAAEMNTAFRIMASATRYLASINTSYNPEFMISNFIRDIQTAGYNLSDTELSGMKKKVAKDVFPAMNGIRNALFGDGSKEWARVWEDFRKAGGKTGWLDIHNDIKTKEKDLNKIVERLQKGKPAKHLFRRFLKGVEDMNNVIENAVRLSAYKNALDSGLSNDRAADLAKDLTVNFNRKGAWGTQANALYMFFNAAVQGNIRLLRAMTKSKMGRNLAMGTIGFAIALDMLNRSLSGDDDDGENIYDQLPDYVKDRNIIVMGEKEPIVKIPAPWGYNVLHTIGQVFGSAISDDRFNVLDGSGRIALSFADAFNPLGSGSAMQMIAPTILDPWAQISENKNFAGNPIKPGHTFDAFNPRPEYQMHFSTVREQSKTIAKALNDLTGGNEVRPGWINVSPESMDLVWDTFTGGLGRLVGNTNETLNNVIQGKEIEVANVPFLRKVTGYNSDYGVKSRYYEWSNDVLYAKKELKTLKGGALVEARKQPSAKLIGLFVDIDRKIKKLRKYRVSAEKAGKSERVVKIDANIRKLMSKFNSRYAELTFNDS